MMKLSQVFEQLTQGELSQVAIGGNGTTGQVAEANYRAVGNHVMLGLTSLYKRFNLKQSRLVVQLMPDIFTYPLQSKYALNNRGSTEPMRWILDSPTALFKDDIIKIHKVSTGSGYYFPINDAMDPYSVVTPTMDSIRVPADVVNATIALDALYSTTILQVEYQANHPNFVPRVNYFDPAHTNIELPYSHLQALLYFVASRVHNPIGMGQEFNAGNTWFAKYEAECQRLEADGAEIDNAAQVDRASRGGWI